MTWQANDRDPRAQIIVALDFPTSEDSLALVRELSPHPGFFKIGLQLFAAAGPEIVRKVRDLGGRVFLDLKLHDIPNTVARAVESVSSLGVEMLTIHLCGGRAMIEAAVRAARPEILLLGVTVLTSIDDATRSEIGIDVPVELQAVRLAQLGVESGIRGLVASPREVPRLRKLHGTKVQIVTPGIRSRGSVADDQKRTMTAAEALRAGADYLVIGRPITGAQNPRAALEEIAAECYSSSC